MWTVSRRVGTLLAHTDCLLLRWTHWSAAAAHTQYSLNQRDSFHSLDHCLLVVVVSSVAGLLPSLYSFLCILFLSLGDLFLDTCLLDFCIFDQSLVGILVHAVLIVSLVSYY